MFSITFCCPRKKFFGAFYRPRQSFLFFLQCLWKANSLDTAPHWKTDECSKEHHFCKIVSVCFWQSRDLCWGLIVLSSDKCKYCGDKSLPGTKLSQFAGLHDHVLLLYLHMITWCQTIVVGSVIDFEINNCVTSQALNTGLFTLFCRLFAQHSAGSYCTCFRHQHKCMFFLAQRLLIKFCQETK